MLSALSLVALAAIAPAAVMAGPKKVSPSNIPYQFYPGKQFGYNNCTTTPDSVSSKCQTIWVNDLQDFCLFAPPTMESVGNSEERNVAYCTKAGHGSRLIPPGTLKGVHIVYTAKYVQITGVGDFTKINVPRGDEGGELDPHGATNIGNPIGGLVFVKQPSGKVVQTEEWSQFISDTEFSLRACYNAKDNRQTCPHIYDEMGAQWNSVGSYSANVFETCQADVSLPPGLYVQKDGTTSTFKQGDKVTPAAHPTPKSSSCVKQKTVAGATYGKAVASPSSSVKKTTTKATGAPKHKRSFGKAVEH